MWLKRSMYLCKGLLIAVLMIQACQAPAPTSGLQPGDLLFQDLNCGPLCDAIEAVTEGVNGQDFSHCGMVVNIHDTLKVIEAIGTEVQLSSLEDFFKRSGDTAVVQNITVGRVKGEASALIEQATAYATQQLGQPYDDAFLLDNGKWYCSELLHESFKAANGGQDFFVPEPMTFKDPEQDAFFPAWVTYYEDLGQAIPEGQYGLNPGSISRSDKLEIIPLTSL